VPSHSARALAASEWLNVCFRAVSGRPSRQLPRLGCARTGLLRCNKVDEIQKDKSPNNGSQPNLTE
jgi:hypothetical protein